MTIGTIKHFKSERGFGLSPTMMGTNTFFTSARIVDKTRGAPVRGQRVSFTVGKNPRNKKYQAIGVELIDPSLEPLPHSDAREIARLRSWGVVRVDRLDRDRRCLVTLGSTGPLQCQLQQYEPLLGLISLLSSLHSLARE
jgi:cold shock CspA family protein